MRLPNEAFQLALHCTAQAGTLAPLAPPAYPCSRMDKGHILIVEDNPKVLAAFEVILHDYGYRTTAATSVGEAIECSRAIADLDLVITDYHLAGKETGRQVVAALRELHGPTFKAIVITGDTSAAVHAFDGAPFLCWLRKPLDTRQLKTILEKFLTEGGRTNASADPQNTSQPHRRV
jgi:CheY-like chemotaxis protein